MSPRKYVRKTLAPARYGPITPEVSYVPGSPGQAGVMDMLAHAIQRQDEGVPGWSGRVAVLKSYLYEALDRGDADHIVRGAESLADLHRGVANRHYRGPQLDGDM